MTVNLEFSRGTDNTERLKKENGMPAWELFIVILILLVDIFIFVSFGGRLPEIGLDQSWQYAMAYDADHSKLFGTEVVFTFGPLSYLYSQFAMPSQRLFSLLVSSAIISMFTLGVMNGCSRRTVFVMLLLPIALSSLNTPDSIFLVLPFFLVTSSVIEGRNARCEVFIFVVMSGILGILPLIKSTTTVSSFFCVLLAMVALAYRGRRELALALPLVATGTLVATWLWVGQTWQSLFYYFYNQIPVISGYTNAMSSTGNMLQVYAYIACSIVLVGALVATRRRLELASVLACVCILFVTFKGSFVRHDGHAAIGAATLLFLGTAAFVSNPNRWRGGAAIACLSTWAYISAAYFPIDIMTDVQKIVDRVTASAQFIVVSINSPSDFATRFEAAKRTVASSEALPATAGTVDLYSYDQALLLASDRTYDPRPVPQSYAAYTRDLAALNAEHLRGKNAPQSIIFAVSPIDLHYPSLDDGKSWPELTSLYKFRSYSGKYVLLDRDPQGVLALPDKTSEIRTYRFDENIDLPKTHQPVWASIKFKPRVLGKIVSAFWKLPLLWMDVVYEDGRIKKYRMIAGMAEGGFLLSPTIDTVVDFVALRSGDDEALGDKIVRSIRLHQDDGSALWGDSFDLSLSSITIPMDPGAAAATPPMIADGPDLSTVAPGGDCNIDEVGAQANGGIPMVVPPAHVVIGGWGLYAAKTGVGSDELRIIVAPDDGQLQSFEATRLPRPDVDAYFQIKPTLQTGFQATANFTGILGPATITVVQRGSDGWRQCLGSVKVDVRD